MFLSGHGASGCQCDAELGTVVSATPNLVFWAGEMPVLHCVFDV